RDAPLLQQLEQAQERGDLLDARDETFEQLREEEPRPLEEVAPYDAHRLLQAERLGVDRVDDRRDLAREHRLERVEEAEHADGEKLARFRILELRRGAPLEVEPALGLEPAQVLGGLLETAVLEELTDESRARILLLLLGNRRREQHARLDPHQGRGHDQELAGDLQVELAHQLQRVEVLPRDLGDGYVGDLELLLLDQMEQEIQRAIEDRDVDLKRGSPLGRRLRHRSAVSRFVHGSFIASRTSLIVRLAIARTFSSPYRSASRTRSGLASSSFRRSRN